MRKLLHPGIILVLLLAIFLSGCGGGGGGKDHTTTPPGSGENPTLPPGSGENPTLPPGNGDPVTISGKKMSAGFGYHNLAVRNESLWAWGRNSQGQLGVGDTENHLTPTQIASLTGVRAVACGSSRSLAATTDGAVYAWGFDGFGYIGGGGNSPKRIHSGILKNIAAVEMGDDLFLALSADGEVYAWGYNSFGEVGDGTTTQKTAPVLIDSSKFDDKRVVAISAGYQHSLALTEDGQVWAWGANSEGQLGDGTTNNKANPTKVTGLTNVIAISGGNSFSVALKSNGTVWAWGDINKSNIPAQVSGLSDIKAISAGSQHCMALGNDGKVRVWGSFLMTIYDNPQVVESLSNVTMIAAGAERCFAQKNDGTLWAWGNNSFGALGDGTTDYKSTPVEIVFP